MQLSSFLRSSFGVLLAAAVAVAGTPSPAVAAVPLVSAAPAPTVGFDGLVYASARVGSTVYVGGSFRNAIVNGRSVPRKRLAAVDTRTGKLLPWAPETNGTVLALAASGSALYASGKFTTVAGQPRAGLAGLHPASGAVGPLRHTVKGEGTALAVGGGRLYLGGTVTAVDGRPVRNLAAFRLSDGAHDTTFVGGADGQVRALSVAGSRLYVGGGFKRLNGTEGTARLAALRLADGQVDPGFRPATPYTAFALAITAGRVYAGLAGPGGRVAAYEPTGNLVWSTVTDGDVQALTTLRGTIYAGGHFTVACDRPSRTATSWCPTTLRTQPKLAALNPETGRLLDWNPRSNGRWGVLTLTAAANAIAVGGEFTAFGSVKRPHFAQFQACFYGCGGRTR
ncbi:PQQ-like beta-propeller repeat protein [Jidongwangia harbinensis]|uniref:PQQ-like beta-propeller repeat protein n=1 Tax=Jidongwangia harbinensis TaxID=2878561 RepID=UPI001CD9E3F2|nr:PQQ-like beta-propeller repeat protein [Jidongwangia harbinensis]MCA2211312.1 PQQ-like beta-propeller repeat protein [Jidongwangia harbinensis]